MKSKPQWLRRLEEHTIIAVQSVSKVASQIEAKTKSLDEQLALTQHAKQLAESMDLRGNLNVLRDGARSLKSTGLYRDVQRTGQKINTYVTAPLDGFLQESGIKNHCRTASLAAGQLYGSSRKILKPYFAPETPQALLITTKKELLYLNACLLQVSAGEAEQLANQFGAAVASKVAGAASAAAVLSMVSALGSASTGTAIASLSGVAATNASLAWVGGLVGGGMAAGAVMTGGLALAVGVGTYHLFSSTARPFESLSNAEQRIVESTGFLVAAINDILNDKHKTLSYVDAAFLLEHSLQPLYQQLQQERAAICTQLDYKNRMAFEHNALVDFERNVIQGFEHFLQQENVRRRQHYPEFAIAGVLYELLNGIAIDNSAESQLVLDALRRMRSDWQDASESQIADNLAGYDAEQLRGVASNVKGIYHELLFVERYNQTHSDTCAEVFAATNHAGADVMIRDSQTDAIVVQYQLKAGSSEQLIRNHFEKYPDIDLLASSEIAQQYGMNVDSGFSNAQLNDDVNHVVQGLTENTLTDRGADSAALSGLIAAGLEARHVLSGKQTVSGAGLNALKASGVAAGSTVLAGLLFS